MTGTRFFCAAVIVLWSCMAVGNTCTAPKPSKISGALCGRLIDATGAAVPNVTLRVLGESDKIIADAEADSKGDFIFPKLAKGKYRLTPTSGGWLIEFGNFEVRSARQACVHPVTVRLDFACCCFGSGISTKRPRGY